MSTRRDGSRYQPLQLSLIIRNLRLSRYIDPREQLTAAFFERHFCWQDDWSTATRSRAIFAVSTLSSSGQQGSSLQATTSTASFDPFSHTYSQPAIGSSSHSSFARKSLQLVLFARLADDTGSHSTSNRSLEILVGRRVVRKRSASISKPRPDDPMPRTSLGELKRESRGSFSAARSSSPADFALAEVKKAAGERKERWKKSMSLPQSRYPLDDTARSLTSRASSVISEEGEQFVRTSLESTARTDGSKRLAAVPGNHTPGRRGEKRHKMNHSASESQLSPTRRRRADDMKLLAPPKRPPERRSSGASDAIKRSGSVSMAHSPEPPDTAAFGDISGAAGADDSSASLRSKSDSLLAHGSASNNTKGSYSALETRNRNLIKKLISHQLLGRGLEKGESEYDKCFMATYNGTLCALRHEIGIQDVERSRAAQVVGSHLNMYLPLGDMSMFAAAPSNSWPTWGNGHGLAPRGNAMEDIKREIKEESGAQSG